MNRNPTVSGALPLLLSCLAGPARAHEMWLAPSRYVAAAGDTVAIRCYVGTGFRGEARPYAATRTLAFRLHSPRETDLRGAAVNGDPTFARFVAPDGGGTLVSYLSDFARIELPAREFDGYLKLEGLDGPLAERARAGPAAGPGRERYARCLKTWIAGGNANRAQMVMGLPLEIVPLTDPRARGALRVRVLFRGRPLEGALVRAWHAPLEGPASPRDAAARDSVGPAAQARTDRLGMATLAVGGFGEWMLSAVHMVPSGDRGEADWESWWASYTFARGARRR